jgi:murein DD-endopeptidase MepM/ murein hydrolase activator NlpD
MVSKKRKKPRYQLPARDRFIAGLKRLSPVRAIRRLFAASGKKKGQPKSVDRVGESALTGTEGTFGPGTIGQSENNISRRFKNATELFLGSSRAKIPVSSGAGQGSSEAGGLDGLDELAADLDLTGLDSEDEPGGAGPKVREAPRVPEIRAKRPEGPAAKVDGQGPDEVGADGSGNVGFRPDGGGEEKRYRPSKTTIGIIILVVIFVVSVWGGLTGIKPPEREAPGPEPVAAVPGLTSTKPLIVMEPDLPLGTLDQDSIWRDSLVIDVYEVPSGGTLSQALEKLSLSQVQRRSLYQLFENKGLFGQINPGERFSAWWANSGRQPEDLERLEYLAVGATRPLIFLPGGPDGFYVVDLGSPPKMIHQATQGDVISTFWEAGEKAGLEPAVILRLVDLLASQIDFVSDIRSGDSFQLLFLGEYQDGRLISKPIIEMIRFTNKDERYEFYRHLGKNGDEGYFDAQFRSIKKNFFKSPLQYSRISSSFTKARFHPILKIVRPHLGVDYAAPTGTPVSAVADGVVDYAGFRGGYGRLVVLKHDGDITTMYGHLSVIAKGVTRGAKVSQGDVIGNVGSSGLATGPHLDFRLRRKGEFVDPEKVLAEQQGQPMPQEERMDFADKVTKDQDMLKQLLEVN